ncbi:Na+/H+ antiporter subunit E [Blastococcus xanthinilyticus]|uniref:Multisubunit sodium/proton antiporter MrpE subunit n=1 Tax=Blastococcus xanthinilyticus TaxID=1564164 RepID=A0A5S5CX51_9ACTN|nr:Na+/H+ antiporter subunit E [Blastococcus xanthinilyticus]TYP87102.1 multisubunit sodium/proton antiporter MrpE subunit [Blastococcus xanthinilyticus]
MSPDALVGRGTRQLPVIAWLVLIWVLLWGSFSWANVLSGLVAAVVVTVAFPLPGVTEHARFRPLAVLSFLGFFLRDLAVSSVQVAWAAARPGPPVRSAVIVVELRTDSDLLLTLIAETLSLVPGSMVLDIDRMHRTMLVHVLPVTDEADVERQRADVLVVEERVVRAFGSSREIAALDGPDGPPAEAAADDAGRNR